MSQAQNHDEWKALKDQIKELRHRRGRRCHWHSNVGITLDLYSQVLLGMQEECRREGRCRFQAGPEPRVAMNDDPKIVAFRPRQKVDDLVVDDNPMSPTPQQLKLIVAWALTMRADGHMPDAVAAAFNSMFREYWQAS